MQFMSLCMFFVKTFSIISSIPRNCIVVEPILCDRGVCLGFHWCSKLLTLLVWLATLGKLHNVGNEWSHDHY